MARRCRGLSLKVQRTSKPRGSAGKGKGPAIVQTKPCDQGNITLVNLSSKIDEITHIVGSVVPVVKEFKRAYDEAGETADDGQREQSSDEDEQPPTKKRKGDANEGGRSWIPLCSRSLKVSGQVLRYLRKLHPF